MKAFFSKQSTISFLLGVAVLVWIAGANAFPKDTIFVLGDYAAPIEPAENFSNFVRDGQGRGVLWYGMYAVADMVGLDSGAQLTWYVFLFLFFSYASMWWALGKVLRSVRSGMRLAFSLLYAANIFVLNLFLSGELFAVSSVLYIVVPAFFAALFSFVSRPKWIDGLPVIVLFFLASTAFLSPASAVGMLLFSLLSVIWLFVFLSREWQGKWKYNILLSIAVAVLIGVVSLSWVWPVLQDIRFGESPYVSRELTTLGWRAVEASTPLSASFRWMVYSEEQVFPEWFPYESWEWSRWIWIVLTCIPLVWLFGAWLVRTENLQDKRFFWTLVAILGVLLMLMTRELPAFSLITAPLFSLPGFKTLVSSGTLSVFVPALMIFIGAWLASAQKSFQKPIMLSVILTLVVAFPLFIGSIHTKGSPFLGDNWEVGKWQDSKPSAVTRIPEEVLEIARVLEDEPEGKVAIFPYDTRGGMMGWEYIPSWGVWGNIDYEALWKRETLRANRPYVDRWIHTRAFEVSDQDPEWLVTFLGSAGVSHIVWHKEIDPEGSYREKLDVLEGRELIRSVYTGEDWNVWSIDQGNVFGHVEIIDDNIPFTESPSTIHALSPLVQEVGRSTRECISTSYLRTCSLTLQKDDAEKIVMLNQPFQESWWAVWIREDGVEVPLRHMRAFGFFNGWSLPENVDEGDRVEIRYSPEKMVPW